MRVLVYVCGLIGLCISFALLLATATATSVKQTHKNSHKPSKVETAAVWAYLDRTQAILNGVTYLDAAEGGVLIQMADKMKAMRSTTDVSGIDLLYQRLHRYVAMSGDLAKMAANEPAPPACRHLKELLQAETQDNARESQRLYGGAKDSFAIKVRPTPTVGKTKGAGAFEEIKRLGARYKWVPSLEVIESLPF
jgi:hypothetical protein